MKEDYRHWLYRRATEIRNGISPFLRLTVNKFRANYEFLYWSGIVCIIFGFLMLLLPIYVTISLWIYAFFATTYGYYKGGYKFVRRI